ncbi:DUF4920 domain-containing protein [Alkalisalibacterium limincola]|uniref:DUF4920 domain-containing protein n=1 Tax=Alkalisalibacterium limincola TaxID=2699169 RepID=A0A5C8KMZ8_9GAMM|nr:DUF4920 domain-containing protein [Alkalisalibacterium limincola]TXK60527.1 DUF4920 domain-containing protein [Alkalisalibacterium limincola]
MNKFLVLALAGLLSLPALAGEARVYGAQMPVGDAVPVSRAIDDLDAHAGAPGKFAGRITQVCQKMGCWLILEDDGHHARVMARDHAYGVPTDSSGRVEVYGVLEVRELSQEQAEHFAEDAGQQGEVDRREYRIVADSIALLD